MTADEAIELIREAAARFADADIAWKKSRIGIFGFWVGDNSLERVETSLQRAQLFEKLGCNCTKA